MMYSESEFLPLSALQHFLYCPRQCALIHVEQQWSENRFTAEGRSQHNRVDRRESEIRDGVRMEYSVPLRSLHLGLAGIADVVEFHSKSHNPDLKSGISDMRLPYPVEHKRGKPKPTDCDRVQLCAQAMCIEEMLNVQIPEGAIFYGQPRRREVVPFTPELRAATEKTAKDVHDLLASGKTPLAEYDEKKCGGCSLQDVCMPRVHGKASAYLKEILDEKAS